MPPLPLPPCSAVRPTGGEQPIFDLLPILQKNADLRRSVVEMTGNLAFLRMNQPFPPFDNAAIRRALLLALNQVDFMAAVVGDTTDPAAQRQIAATMQAQAFVDVPFLPLGQFFQPTVQRRTLVGGLTGMSLFWNIRRA